MYLISTFNPIYDFLFMNYELFDIDIGPVHLRVASTN